MTEQTQKIIEQLISQAMQDQLSHEEWLRLDTLLNESDEHVDFFYQCVELHALLRRKAKGILYILRESGNPSIGADQHKLKVYDLQDIQISDQNKRKALEEKIQKQAKEQLEDYLNQYSTVSQRGYKSSETIPFPRFRWPIKFVTAVAVCLFVTASLWLVFSTHDHQSAPQIVQSYNAQWHETTRFDEKQRLLHTTDYKLQEGMVEIAFENGVKMILEGPAEMKPDLANGAYLAQGKLVASVPPHAKGFTIKTPHAEFVDLGTEFGVLVDESFSVLSVFDGEVGIRMPGESTLEFVRRGERKRVEMDSKTILDVTDVVSFVHQIPTDPIENPASPTITKLIIKPYNNTATQKGSFSISGTIDGSLKDVGWFNEIYFSITSKTTNKSYNERITISDSDVREGKLTYEGQKGNITSLKMDFNQGTFSIDAEEIDLIGVAGAFIIEIEVGKQLWEFSGDGADISNI